MYLTGLTALPEKHVNDGEHAVHDVSITTLTTLLNASRCAQLTYMPSQARLQRFSYLSC